MMRYLYNHTSFKRRSIRIDGKQMNVLIADTPRKMTVGLMFRPSLRQNECMLFIFPHDGSHPIWTRNMRFPIDIVWCDRDGLVMDFAESVRPAAPFDFSGYHSVRPARYVLEFNAGFVKKNRVKIEQKIMNI